MDGMDSNWIGLVVTGDTSFTMSLYWPLYGEPIAGISLRMGHCMKYMYR